MESIRIDLSKLLGFKIVANSEASALQTPKIGGKPLQIPNAPVGAKIGGKVLAGIASATIGAKVGAKPTISSAAIGAKIGLKPIN